jgi:hypothetical protein
VEKGGLEKGPKQQLKKTALRTGVQRRKRSAKGEGEAEGESDVAERKAATLSFVASAADGRRW